MAFVTLQQMLPIKKNRVQRLYRFMNIFDSKIKKNSECKILVGNFLTCQKLNLLGSNLQGFYKITTSAFNQEDEWQRIIFDP